MRKNLETYLTESGRFSSDQLGDARRTQRFFGGSLLSNMVRLGYINEADAGKLFAEWSGYPYVPFRELKKASIPPDVLETVEPEVAARRKVVPFLFEEGELHVVTCSADNEIFFLELGRRVNAAVVPHIMPDERVEQLLERHYGVASGRKEAVPVPMEDAADAAPSPAERPSFEPEDTAGLPSDIGLDGLPLDSELSALGDGGASMGVSLTGISGNASRSPAGQTRSRGGGDSQGGGKPPAGSKYEDIGESQDDRTHGMVGYARPGSGAVERPFSPPTAPGAPPLSRSAPVREPGSSMDGPDIQAREPVLTTEESSVEAQETGATLDAPGTDARPGRRDNPFDTGEIRRPSLDLGDAPAADRTSMPEAPLPLDVIRDPRPDDEAHAEHDAPHHARVTDKGPLSIDNPLQILSRALDRERIGKAAVELVLSMGASRVALFSHQQERLVGWEAGGTGVQDRLFARLSLPLYAPSIFSSMRVKATPYVGIVPDQPANNEFLQTLGGTAPGLGTAVPVTLKGRLVAVLYADGGPGSRQVMALERLQDAASKLALALEVLLLRRKILT